MCPAGVAAAAAAAIQESGRVAAVAVGNGIDMLRPPAGPGGFVGTVAEAAHIGSGPDSAARNCPVGFVDFGLAARPVVAVGGVVAGTAARVKTSHDIGIAAGCCCIGYWG